MNILEHQELALHQLLLQVRCLLEQDKVLLLRVGKQVNIGCIGYNFQQSILEELLQYFSFHIELLQCGEFLLGRMLKQEVCHQA